MYYRKDFLSEFIATYGLKAFIFLYKRIKNGDLTLAVSKDGFSANSKYGTITIPWPSVEKTNDRLPD